MKHNFFLRGYFKNRGYEDSAELAKDEIISLPPGAPQKTFTFEAKQLFDKVDTAKLKNQKSLDAAGDFLTDTDFGVAVVAVVFQHGRGCRERLGPDPRPCPGGPRVPG